MRSCISKTTWVSNSKLLLELFRWNIFFRKKFSFLNTCTPEKLNVKFRIFFFQNFTFLGPCRNVRISQTWNNFQLILLLHVLLEEKVSSFKYINFYPPSQKITLKIAFWMLLQNNLCLKNYVEDYCRNIILKTKLYNEP